MTSLLSAQVFKKRRQQLMQKIGGDAIAIIPAAPHHLRNRDTHYSYRQDSDFYYLTGFAEPEAVLVLAPGYAEGESILFCRPKDKAAEIWDGYRAGPIGAVKNYGMDSAYLISELEEKIIHCMTGREKVIYPMARDMKFDRRLLSWINQLQNKVRSGVAVPRQCIALDSILHELRLIKSTDEIKIMQAAANISVHAHQHAMQVCRPGMKEYELEAEYLRVFYGAGSRSPAYPSIVAGGANACVLHYVENNQVLNSGDLVLVDAGAELDYYASDITRTFPVNGRFTPAQRALYDLVLDAQLAAIEKVRVGYHWNEPHEAAVKVLTEGLVKLKILSGSVNQLIKKESYKSFYMHRTGHWLGMDVHDVGAYKLKNQWRPLKSGMVLTVEPGLYIAPDADVANKWKGIGIRIEDDVLVTSKGPQILTAALVKKSDDIEQLMKG